MTETPETMGDETLLAQINAHDPYDVEFARRFRALSAENAALRARAETAEAEVTRLKRDDEFEAWAYRCQRHEAEALDRLRGVEAEVEMLRGALALLRGVHINWDNHEDAEKFAALVKASE